MIARLGARAPIFENIKEAIAALEAYRKKNGVKKNPKRHEKMFERDTFLRQMLKEILMKT